MIYTDFSIEMTSTEMLQTAMKDSTQKRYARLLLEGAEIIRQLRKERDRLYKFCPNCGALMEGKS